MTVSGAGAAELLRAVVALEKSGDPRAVRPLVDLLGDKDKEIRLSATTALGCLKNGRPLDELIRRLRDQSEEMVIRRQAAVSLTSIRSNGAFRGLREFVTDEAGDPKLRSYSGTLLQDIGVF